MGAPADAGDWAVVGVEPGTPLDAARAAYLARARLLHPDRHPDATPDERRRLDAAMAALNLAWARIEAAPPPPPSDQPAPVSRPGLTWLQARPPDGFALWSSRGITVGYRLRLWTDDLEPLHLLAHGSLAVAVTGLDLHRRPVGDAALHLLTHLPALEVLDLGGTDVTDDGLRLLARLPSLRDLRLGGTAVTDAGLAHLAAATHLQALELTDTSVTGAGLAALAGLPLSSIVLRGADVGADGLEELARWPHLRLVALPHVDRAARHRLVTARPDLTLT